MSSTLRGRAASLLGAFVLALLLALVADPASAQSTWLQTAAGTYSWQTGANWSTDPSVPNGADGVANLTNDIAGDQVITLDAAVTLGTLGIGDASGTSGFTLAAGSGGPLTFDVTTGSAAITKTTGGADTISTPITLADALSVTVSTGTLTMSGNIGNSVSSTVTKLGAGRLVLSGTNNYTGLTTVRAGTLDLTAGQISTTSNNSAAIGVGTNAGNVATMIVSGGTLSATSGGLNVGTSGTGTFNQTGGTVSVSTAWLGDQTGGVGTANLSGGSFTSSGDFTLATRSVGTLTVSGTANVTVANLRGGFVGGTSATVNLDGGTLRVNQVSQLTAPTTFSFNGGTLVARQNSATFFSANNLNNLTVQVKSGGAIIDTGAFNVTIAPALVAAAGSPGGGLTKFGTGSLTLSGSNTYTSATTIAAGSLVIGTGGSLNGTTGTALSFTGSGRFAATPAAGIPQGMGVLSLTAGNGDVESTWAGSGTSTLAFSALAPRGATATGNFVTSGGTIGTDNRITLAGQAAGFIDQRLFAGGNAFAWYDAGGFVRGLAYDGVEGTTSAGGTSISGSHVQVTGPVTAQETGSFTTLALTDASEFTLAAGQTVTVNGILKSGGSAGGTLSGGSGIRAATGQPLVIRTDQAADTLTLGTPVLGGGTASLIKAGAGTLTMNVAGTYGGLTVVNGGTLQTPASTTLSFAGGLEVAAGATFALGSPSAVAQFTSLAGAGTVVVAGASGGNGSSPDAFIAAQTNPSTFSGYLGTASNRGSQFVKAGPATLTVTGMIETLGTTSNPAGYGSGRFRLIAGELILAGTGGSMTGGSAANAGPQDSRSYLANGATLTLDNSNANNNNRINDGSNKSSGNLLLSGATFNYVGNSSVDSSETYGGGNDTSGTDFGAGQSVYSVAAGAGRKATVTSTKGFTRAAGGTALFRGTNLGDGTRSTILAGVASPPTLTGGAGTTSSTTATNIAILPWAVGDTSATGSGAGLVTYDATLGIRPLATTNYAGYADSADTTDNVRMAAATTLAASKTVNALVVDAGGGSLTLTGTGQTVTLTSGALALVGGNAVTLAGGTYAFGAAEGIVHAFADTSMSGSFTGSGGVTKAGFGTLAVSTAQTYTGVTRLSGGVLKLDVANALPGGIGSTGGTSNLTLSGGVLGLATGDFTRTLGTGVTQVQFAGNGGFAAYGADRDVNLGGSATPSAVTWNSGQFLVNTLLLGAPSADAKIRFRNPIALGANAPRMIEVANGSAPVDAELSGVVSGTGVSGIIKTGPGTLVLSAASTYTGDTTVYAGRLLVNGSLTATGRTTVLPGATLGGSGSIAAAISGGGTISPGNSPGILAATQFDGSGGLGAVFEFTGTTPNWADATASVNDVLRLTSATAPLAASLSAANEIDILFDIAGLPGAVPVAQGTYTGGFFTDVQSDFLSSLSLGDFRYWVRGTFGGTQQSFDGVVYSPLSAFDPSLSVTLRTVPVTAGFTSGSISGQSMQLVVVPEPGGLLVAGVGIVVVGAGLARRRRLTACRPS